MDPHSPSLQDPLGDPVAHTDMTDEEISLLNSRLQAWMDATKDRKKDQFEAVCEELCTLPCVTPLNRHQWDVHKKDRLTKYQCDWMAQVVVMRTKKVEITALIQEKRGAKPGEAEMIGNYQWAVRQVVGKMTEEELDKAEQEADQWNRERPPLVVQADTTAHKGKQYAHKFSSAMWKQCDMQVVILEAWQNEDKQVLVSSHDFNTELDGGKSFDSLQGIQKDWDLYAKESFGGEPNAAEVNNNQAPPAGLLKFKARQDPVELVTRRNGQPWLSDIKDASLGLLKNIVQGYFTCAVILGDGSDALNENCDIVLHLQGGGLRHLSHLHHAYSTLHYILLFPRGEEGWHLGIPLHDCQGRQNCSKKVTQLLYYAYCLHLRSLPHHDSQSRLA
ncbi:hypothetical protein PAXRUDRAFT_178085 [Paxillus rubicundulus Ve08.2h10]|uniref:Uncharacterized protein n=1 Tax=Paxillus rubicundulus Ve08.2h10 TaxID=930991 RepID=A0A0D0BPW0_9AGAM|nr:hypothetical protein PAXRUDRAFT_178085 [Paxillus rubicundulus Ve08.2h10]